MPLSLSHINFALKKLNISTSGVVRQDWLELLCPLSTHGSPDKHYGNCSIHIPTGIIACFSCHGRTNIFKLYQKAFNISYKQAVKEIGQGTDLFLDISKEKQSIPETFTESKASYNFTHTKLNPTKYYYTQKRGFSEAFCTKFNIQHCLSEPYSDYMVIPIIDTELNIFEYECRKLMEYEYLLKYFKMPDISYETLKKLLKQQIQQQGLRVFKRKLIDRSQKEIQNDILKYLVQNKVFYPWQSKNKFTLWNMDDLDFSEDLWFTEGLGSIPKIYDNITQNCTATFGSLIPETQIKQLKRFKSKLIHIPDLDPAGYKSVKNLTEEFSKDEDKTLLERYFIKVPRTEDTDVSFVKDLEKVPLLTPTEYLSKYVRLNFLK